MKPEDVKNVEQELNEEELEQAAGGSHNEPLKIREADQRFQEKQY